MYRKALFGASVVILCVVYLNTVKVHHIVDRHGDEFNHAVHLSKIPDSVIRSYSSAYPAELHDYIMAEIANGNEHLLDQELKFDYKTAAAEYEQKMAEVSRVRRRLQGTPNPIPVSAPTAPPTPDIVTLGLDVNGDTLYVAVELSGPISWSTARGFCNDELNSNLGYVDKSDERRLSDKEQSRQLSTVCADLVTGGNHTVNCWIGMQWKLDGDTTDDFKWVGSIADPYFRKTNLDVGETQSWFKPWKGTVPTASWFVGDLIDNTCVVAVNESASYTSQGETYTHGWTTFDCDDSVVEDEPVTGVVCVQTTWIWDP